MDGIGYTAGDLHHGRRAGNGRKCSGAETGDPESDKKAVWIMGVIKSVSAWNAVRKVRSFHFENMVDGAEKIEVEHVLTAL